MSFFASHRRLWIVLLLCLASCLTACTLNNVGVPAAVSGDPVVRILSPLPNATYFEGIAVNIQAQVSNAGANIDRVEVVIDGATVATLSAPNPTDAAAFNVTHGWSATGLGAHTISLTAYRPDGSTSAPVSVEITVVAQNGQTGQATQPTLAAGSTQQQQSVLPPQIRTRPHSRLLFRPLRRRLRPLHLPRPPHRLPPSRRGSTSAGYPVWNSIRRLARLRQGKPRRLPPSIRRGRGTKCATAAAMAGFSPR